MNEIIPRDSVELDLYCVGSRFCPNCDIEHEGYNPRVLHDARTGSLGLMLFLDLESAKRQLEELKAAKHDVSGTPTSSESRIADIRYNRFVDEAKVLKIDLSEAK